MFGESALMMNCRSLIENQIL